MGRCRIMVWLMRNACRRNKLSLICVLGFLSLLYLNQGTSSRVDQLDQYKRFVQNYTFPSPPELKLPVKTSVPPKTTTPAPDGYTIARYIQSFCPSQNHTPVAPPSRRAAPPSRRAALPSRRAALLSPKDNKANQITVRYTRNKDGMLCPVYKVGSTFWRRIFMMESDHTYNRIQHPYQIPFDKEFKGDLYQINAHHRPNFTFMFTRDPYSRLFSTYVDKLLAPNPYYWKVLGEKIVKLTRGVGNRGRIVCGHDVTFPEFIKFVIYSLEKSEDIDPHFVQMDKNCRPCDVKYDFIGKMETFAKDSAVCLEKMNLHGVVEILKTNGSELSSLDAMLDTLSQPFSFRRRYSRCITFSVALQRSWKKLQIRGLIGEDPLDLKMHGKNLDAVTLKHLMSRARKSRQNATSNARRKLKRNFYQEFWKQINVTDLYKIKSLYSTDFKLFDYDSEPVAVFQNRTLL